MDIDLFEHRIVDEFLSKDVFDELSVLSTDHVGPTELQVYHHVVELDQVSSCDLLDKDLVERIHNTHHHGMMQLLQELAPEKVELYDHSDIHIVMTGKDYKFPIHEDISRKILSTVVYLAPRHSRGTLLYSTEAGADAYEVEWKQNRALIFSRQENISWHSYEGNGVSNRLALVYNLKSKP